MIRRVFGSVQVRLAYADCDPAGIVYFASWFPWMERILSGWAYEHGLRPDELQQNHGFSVLIRQTECEYLHRAKLFDQIRVDMDSATIGATSIRWGFTMTRIGDLTIVGRGHIVWVTVDRTGTPLEIPNVLREAVMQDAEQ